MIKILATSIVLLLCASIVQGGVVEPPPPTGPCCEAIPFAVGGNLEGVEEIEEAEVPSVAACCDLCKQTENCLGYVFFQVEENLGTCSLLPVAHQWDYLMPFPFPIYSGNNIDPSSASCTSADCTTEMDIFVVLDKSKSVMVNGEHDAIQTLLDKVLSSLYYGDNELGTRASVTMFGGSAKKLIRLDSPEATDMDAIVDAVTFEEEPNLGWTDLAKTFRYLLRKEFPKSRPNAQKLIYIVSDGRIVKNLGTAKRELKKAEKVLQQIQNQYEKVSVYSIGVGNFNLDNLLKLSTVHPVLDGFLGDGPLVFPIEEMVDDDGYASFVMKFLVCATNNFLVDILDNPPRAGKSGIVQSILKASKKKVGSKEINYTDMLHKLD